MLQDNAILLRNYTQRRENYHSIIALETFLKDRVDVEDT